MEAVAMVKTEDVMNTLFKANNAQVEKFANTLCDATTLDSQMVDGAQLDKLFSFGMMLTYCDKCREPHWFVAFAEHGTALAAAVPEGMAVDLIPIPTFEEAVNIYQNMNNDEVKH